MIGVNKVILVGSLGGDPEFKQANGHSALCKFSVATNRKWKTPEGELKEHTEWHNVVLWGKAAENCSKYLHKGSKVYVEGRMERKEYMGKNGDKRFWVQVQAYMVNYLDSKMDKERVSMPQPQPQPTKTMEQPPSDDLPF